MSKSQILLPRPLYLRGGILLMLKIRHGIVFEGRYHIGIVIGSIAVGFIKAVHVSSLQAFFSGLT